MALAAMIEDGFPHGTVEGYRLGCKGAICPATKSGLSCERFTVRYRGDLAFSRAVDAGESVESILAREKAAQAQEQQVQRVPKINGRYLEAAQKREVVRAHHGEGLTNEEIHNKTGFSLGIIKHALRHYGLTAHQPPRKVKDAPHGTWRRYNRGPNGEPGCRDNCPATPTCREVMNARRWENKKKAAA